jgi:hypothetical protein
MKIETSTKEFLLFFEKKMERMNRIAEVTIKGVLGDQSLKIPCRIFQSERGCFIFCRSATG